MSRYSLIPLLTAALLLLIAGACGGNDEPTPTQERPAVVAMNGDSVTVHYRGTLDSGEEFDSSRLRGPITFFVGAGEMIAGFDAAVHGLAAGETITVHLEPAQAYGEYLDELILDIPSAQAPEGLVPGDVIQFSGGATAAVLEVTDESVKVDANHPLAGEALTFEIEILSIQ
jgi:peptidylprolyl isomerase